MKTIVYAHGRFNPPHWGHQAIVDKVKLISDELRCDHMITLSSNYKPLIRDLNKNPTYKVWDKNPFNTLEKMNIFRKMFPYVNSTIADITYNNFMGLAQYYSLMGYDKIIYVCGSDRVDEVKEALLKYNNTIYFFDEIEVVSAGEPRQKYDKNFAIRDFPGAWFPELLSGTMIRNYAYSGDYESFYWAYYKDAKSLNNLEIMNIYTKLREATGIQ